MIRTERIEAYLKLLPVNLTVNEILTFVLKNIAAKRCN